MRDSIFISSQNVLYEQFTSNSHVCKFNTLFAAISAVLGDNLAIFRQVWDFGAERRGRRTPSEILQGAAPDFTHLEVRHFRTFV